MLRHRSLVIMLAIGTVSAVCMPGRATAQSINENYSFTAASGSMQQSSVAAVAPGTGFLWSVTLQDLIANGSIFGQPVPLPLSQYGVSLLDMSDAGVYSGVLPGVLWSHRYTFTDLGAGSPTFDFTVSLTLNADRTATAGLVVHSLGMFTVGGITGTPVPVPLDSLTVNGNVQVSPLIPAPGSLALAAIAGILTMRRRR